jgi:hypothetical protein
LTKIQQNNIIKTRTRDRGYPTKSKSDFVQFTLNQNIINKGNLAEILNNNDDVMGVE